MNKTRKQKNILIGGLLAVVLVMAIGYAAFASQLNITGTSNISSNWNIKITGIRGANKCLVWESDAETSDTHCNSSKNNAYDLTAPTYDNTNGLTASFQTGLKLPGDTRIYEIEVTNQGDLNANITKTLTDNTNNPAIEITYDGVSSSSILKEDGTYKKSSLSTGEPFTLNKNNKKYVYITVKYSDSVTSQPSNLNASVTLSLNATQKTSAISRSLETLADGTYYAYNTEMVMLNTNSFYKAWNTDDEYYEAFIDSESCTSDATEPENCTAVDVSLPTAIGTETNWENKNFFNKYVVSNGVITEAYSCTTFGISGFEPVCLQGSIDGSTYGYDANGNHSGNAGILKTLSTNSTFTGAEGSCNFDSYNSRCFVGDLYLFAGAGGYVSAYDDGTDARCDVNDDGTASCNE